VEYAMVRVHVFQLDALLPPLALHAGADDNVVKLAVLRLIGKQRTRAAQEVGAHPAVRCVADEARRTRIMMNNFRPVVPTTRTAMRHEPVGTGKSDVRLAQANEGSNHAPFVWRVL